MELHYCEICGVAISPKKAVAIGGGPDAGSICDRCFQSRKVIVPEGAGTPTPAPMQPVPGPMSPAPAPMAAAGPAAPPAAMGPAPATEPPGVVRFDCPHCASELQIRAVRKRTKIKCPKCTDNFYLHPEGNAEPIAPKSSSTAGAMAPIAPAPDSTPARSAQPPAYVPMEPVQQPSDLAAPRVDFSDEVLPSGAIAERDEDSVALVAEIMDTGSDSSDSSDEHLAVRDVVDEDESEDHLAEFNPPHDFFGEVPERSSSFTHEVLEGSDEIEGAATFAIAGASVPADAGSGANAAAGDVLAAARLMPEDRVAAPEPEPELEILPTDEPSRADKMQEYRRTKRRPIKKLATSGPRPAAAKTRPPGPVPVKKTTGPRPVMVRKTKPKMVRRVVGGERPRTTTPPAPKEPAPPALEPVAPADPAAAAVSTSGVLPGGVDRDAEARKAFWTGAILMGLPILLAAPILYTTVRGAGFGVRGIVGEKLDDVGQIVGDGVRRLDAQTLRTRAFPDGPLPTAGGAQQQPPGEGGASESGGSGAGEEGGAKSAPPDEGSGKSDDGGAGATPPDDGDAGGKTGEGGS